MSGAPIPSLQAALTPIGEVEPHAGSLKLPMDGQLLYKVMKVEHLLASIEGNYLHFNRVDSYPDLPGYDPRDGEQLPSDRVINSNVRFERDPGFTVDKYYDQSRARTYACCFALENTEHIWQAYANEAKHGKIGVVFDFQKLRERLNRNWEGNAQLLFGTEKIRQIFSINYGIIEYVDWDQQRANDKFLPNPILYTYTKARQFAEEHELRVSLSALGIGNYVIKSSTAEFPKTIRVGFDFRAALVDSGIKEFLIHPDFDDTYLKTRLAQLGIDTTSSAAGT